MRGVPTSAPEDVGYHSIVSVVPEPFCSSFCYFDVYESTKRVQQGSRVRFMGGCGSQLAFECLSLVCPLFAFLKLCHHAFLPQLRSLFEFLDGTRLCISFDLAPSKLARRL